MGVSVAGIGGVGASMGGAGVGGVLGFSEANGGEGALEMGVENCWQSRSGF